MTDIYSVLLHQDLKQNRKKVPFLPLKMFPKVLARLKSLSTGWQKHKKKSRNLLKKKKKEQNKNMPLHQTLGEKSLVKQNMTFHGKIKLSVGVRLRKQDPQNTCTLQVQFLRGQRRHLKAAWMRSIPRGPHPN